MGFETSPPFRVAPVVRARIDAIKARFEAEKQRQVTYTEVFEALVDSFETAEG